MNLARSVNYYVDRLVFQYRDKPNARAMTAIMVKQALVDGLLGVINDAFCVDTAVGKQLDIIGKYVGIPRNIGDPSALPFFGFWDSTVTDPGLQNVNGFQDSTNPAMNPDALFFQGQQQGSRNTDLGDEAYRFMIKLKIASNHMDASLASIDDLMLALFPTQLAVVDNEDMSLTYYYTALVPVAPYVFTPYLPRPMGCSLSVVAMTATAAPDTLSYDTPPITQNQYCYSAAPGVVSVSGGVGPFTYLWQNVGDIGNQTYTAEAVDPTAASTLFRKFYQYGGINVISMRCRVTDSLGLVVYTNTITVTLKSMAPSP